MYGYIYKTTNLVNGKIYVGQHTSKTFNSKYLGSGKVLKKAIDKYGIDNFCCEIIEVCNSLEELNEKEIYWISKLQSKEESIGYNIADGGNKLSLSGKHNPMFGKKNAATLETKMKISNSLQKYYETHDGYWKNKTHSDETKKKMSISRTGKKLVRRIKDYKPWNCGKPLTEEQKQRLRLAHTGKHHDITTKEKISNSLKGRIFSDEHRKKLSEKAKIREENKRKEKLSKEEFDRLEEVF